jgi:hypothetical protein
MCKKQLAPDCEIVGVEVLVAIDAARGASGRKRPERRKQLVVQRIGGMIRLAPDDADVGIVERRQQALEPALVGHHIAVEEDHGLA